jgi:hypothetical protein
MATICDKKSEAAKKGKPGMGRPWLSVADMDNTLKGVWVSSYTKGNRFSLY